MGMTINELLAAKQRVTGSIKHPVDGVYHLNDNEVCGLAVLAQVSASMPVTIKPGDVITFEGDPRRHVVAGSVMAEG